MKNGLGTTLFVLMLTMLVGCGSNAEPATEVSEPGTEAEQVVEETVEETGPSVEELEAQAKEAVDKEDYDTALSFAKEAGAIDAASETKIKDMVKDAYLSKIEACTSSNDYEKALTLINEGNSKLGEGELDEKLSDIPAAIANNVQFENTNSVDSFILIAFTKKQGDEWQLIDDTACTHKDDASHIEIKEVTEKDIDDNNKEYSVVLTQDIAYKVCYPTELDPINWFYHTDILNFFDYYTGKIIRTTDATLDVGENSTNGAKSNVIMWKGQEYPIEITVDKERKEGPQEFLDDGPQGTYVTGCSSNITYKYTITCPKDYDGLCMCLMKPSAVPADAEEQMKEASYKEGGVELNSEEGEEDVYLFKDKYYFGVIPSSDTLYMMRVDDMATKEVIDDTTSETVSETSKADNTANKASNTSQQAKNESTQKKTDNHDGAYYEKNIPVVVQNGHQEFLRYEYVSQADIDATNSGYGTNSYAMAAASGVPYVEPTPEDEIRIKQEWEALGSPDWHWE